MSKEKDNLHDASFIVEHWERVRYTQSYSCMQEDLVSDLNPWPPDHKVETIPLHQGSLKF